MALTVRKVDREQGALIEVEGGEGWHTADQGILPCGVQILSLPSLQT